MYLHKFPEQALYSLARLALECSIYIVTFHVGLWEASEAPDANLRQHDAWWVVLKPSYNDS